MTRAAIIPADEELVRSAHERLHPARQGVVELDGGAAVRAAAT